MYPETDDSAFLDLKGIHIYQMLTGMVQWAVCVSRLDIDFSVSSLNRFNMNPHINYLKLALHLFGYLKTIQINKC